MSGEEGESALLALPEGLTALVGGSLAEEAERIHEELGYDPFLMQKLDGEGYWLQSFGWNYLAPDGPYAVLELSGTAGWDMGNLDQPSHCNFAEYTADFRETVLRDVTVAVPSPELYWDGQCD